MSKTMTDPDRQHQRRADEIFEALNDYERDCIAQTGTAFTTYEDEGDEVCAWLEARVRAWRCTHLTKSEIVASDERDVFAIGDRVQHTKSGRIGRVRGVRACPDGTTEMQVDIDFDDLGWSSRHVRKLTAAEETR